VALGTLHVAAEEQAPNVASDHVRFCAAVKEEPSGGAAGAGFTVGQKQFANELVPWFVCTN
jgi:hypothetical protein